MMCQNGLHEIDPSDPWRGPDKRKCQECYKIKTSRANEKAFLNGSHAKAQRAYCQAGRRKPRFPPYDRRARARSLCRKYGVPLKFYDDLGWYPQDIREALDGSS